MIRVNLKKGGRSGGGSTLAQIDLKDLKSFKPSFNLKSLAVTKSSLNATGLILTLVAVAIAAFPHLFFLKYRAHIETEHQENLASLKAEIDSVKTEIAKYETYQTEMKSFEEQESKINQRLNVVKQLQTSRTGPVNILDAVGQALPQRVWLTGIEMNISPSNQIQLNGKGYSSEDVAEFVDKLNSSIYFEKVILDGVSTEKDGEQSGTVKSFLIVAVPKLSGLGLSENSTRSK